MANILDYVQWRADLTLENSPFNPVDNLILTQLSYTLWEDVVGSGFSDEIRLEDAIVDFFKNGGLEKEMEYGYFSRKDLLELLRRIVHSNRYKDMKICGYQTTNDYVNEEQFAAVTFILDEKTIFVTYRGTDSSILGWKEDFNMSFKSSIPGQNRAKDYLHDAIINFDSKVIVAGHSKGGNFAVYAASCIPEVIQDRIIAVYNNDGPGFMDEFYETTNFRNIKDRLHTYVPQSSIIGMILEHGEECTVIRSNGNGILQHDAFSWDVDVKDFVYLESNTVSSQVMDKSLKDWVEGLDYEQKQKFVNAVFELIESTGVKTTTELRSKIFLHGYSVLKSYIKEDEETRRLIGKGFGYLAKAIVSNMPPVIDQIKGK